MLNTLANFALGSRYKAMVAAGLLAMPGFVLPPLLWLSCGVIALVVLVNGALEGLGIIALGVALMVIPALVFGGSAVLGIATFASWVAVLFAAMALLKTRSLEIGVIASVLAGVAALGLSSVLITSELAAGQLAVFQKAFPAVFEGRSVDVDVMLYGLWAGQAMSVFLSTLIGLFIGRSMQARVTKPGAFREEFETLMMGKPFALTAIVVAIIAVLVKQPILLAILVLMLLGLLMQGIAVAHRLAGRSKQGLLYLVMFYVGLFVLSLWGLLFVAVVGIADNWLNLRNHEQVEN